MTSSSFVNKIKCLLVCVVMKSMKNPDVLLNGQHVKVVGRYPCVEIIANVRQYTNPVLVTWIGPDALMSFCCEEKNVIWVILIHSNVYYDSFRLFKMHVGISNQRVVFNNLPILPCKL